MRDEPLDGALATLAGALLGVALGLAALGYGLSRWSGRG